ncbi:golgin subfamily A member 6-like protein 1, partial [Temnothorax curvispinosus]|uniref:Golgin subfamily A member 6-like protein 1 n=1 Tax=Temnothorax curvispinosus TaxID=300111 RepID=A0A6J1R1D6_9HYME
MRKWREEVKEVRNDLRKVKGWRGDLRQMIEDMKEGLREQGRLMRGEVEELRRKCREREEKWNEEKKKLVSCIKELKKKVEELERNKEGGEMRENKDKEFWTGLKEWDVMVLLETWLDDKGWKRVKERLPEGYEWGVQTAKRKNKKGRAMGRMVMGIKKKLVKKGERIVGAEEGIMTGKVYVAVLAERLREEVEHKGIIPPNQTGFRKGMRTVDNIYVLNYLINRQIRRKGGKVVALFVDLKAAFDSVDREVLMEALRERGVREGLVERIEEVLRETRSRVRAGKELGEFLDSKRVLLAEGEDKMRSMMERLKKYLDKKSLQLNAEKTKIMKFRKGGGRMVKKDWRWKGRKVEEVKEFRYLG